MFLFAFQEVKLIPDGTLFIHIALILIMIWVLNRTLFRPINRILDARDKNKGGHSSEAQEILKSVSAKQAQIEQTMLEARSEGYEIIERTRSVANVARQEKISAVKTEVTEQVERETQQLETQTEEARAAIAADAGRLADRISANILKSA